MIEIIIDKVDMPAYLDRVFQKLSKNSRDWYVVDTRDKKTVYSGSYEDCSLACHNLNKKFYKELEKC